MRVRSTFAFAATIARLLRACTRPAATPTPATTPASTATPAGTAPPSAPPSTEPTDGPSAPPSEPASDWVIGVVTDVGTVDDKNFNEYSFLGATNGAADIGAPAPDVAVPADPSQYASLIQNLLDSGHNIIVTVGFNLANDTAIAAKANPDVWFIGVDQAPCLDENGDPDTTFACAGDLATLLPNFVGLQYAEDQAGYLAGIVAASLAAAADSDTIGGIGGINLVPAVVRYLQGYELGAQSVNPDINVLIDYVSTSDFAVAFNDPGAGKTFADQFIATNSPSVMFQVAGKTGNGVLESACAAGIHGIGVDVDQWLSLAADTTPTYQCIVTSAEKHLASSVQQTIQAIADGTAVGGVAHFDATNDGIGISPEHSGAGLITADVQALLDAALAGMQANDGSVVTCPANCGQP
jgi:basic membrane protein A and related proteins